MNLYPSAFQRDRVDRIGLRRTETTRVVGPARLAATLSVLCLGFSSAVFAGDPPAKSDPDAGMAANRPTSIAQANDDAATALRGGDSTSVRSNPEPASADSFIESVHVDRENAERVRVSRNSTAVINLKQKADGVQVADPNIADFYLVSPTRIVVSGKTYGSTQLLLRFGDQQKTFHIDVELDMSALTSFIASNAPTSRIEARSVNGVIMLTGTVPDADTAAKIVGMAGLVQGGEVRSNLTVAGVQQTMLRVVVAEVNKEASRQLGVNWAVGASDWSRDFFFANNVANINPTVFSSSGLANVLTGQQLYGVAGVGNGPNTNITFGFPKAEFQVFLNALRENGLARTLAEPNLVAISGQTASFLAGGEVPIPVAQAGASAGAITVEYREFGVRLGFTPTILNGQIIRLHVMSEVSEAVPTTTVVGGFPLFTFTTRRVESTIECGNGQTFAIAGLLNDRIRANASKIPGLGDLPVLGAMFSSTAYERSMTELVVLVTPQLVEPLDPQQVPPPPGSLMTEPTDFELFGLQKLEGQPLARSESDEVPRERYPVKTRPGGTSRWPTSQFALRGPWGLADFEEK
ncbi:MAG: type II and III secretion system protein family protein [Phycisphaerae bacterium]|nr:type II and III secretion system protein family protein [Phycisphaerae bacterium]